MKCAYVFDPERKKLQALIRRHQRGVRGDGHRRALAACFEQRMASHPAGVPLRLSAELAVPMSCVAIESLIGAPFDFEQLGESVLIGFQALLPGARAQTTLSGTVGYRPVIAAMETALESGAYTPGGVMADLATFAEQHQRPRDFVVMSCAVLAIATTSLNRALPRLLRMALGDDEIRRSILSADPDAALTELMRLYPPQPKIVRVDDARTTEECRILTRVDVARANRDPDIHDEPDRFMPTRKAKQALTFGAGAFACDGVPMTGIYMRETIASLLRRTSGLRVAAADDDHMSILYDAFA